MRKCFACEVESDNLVFSTGEDLCEKCISIKELTLDGHMGRDFFMIMPIFPNIFFFTHNRLIVTIYHMQKGTTEAGIAVNHHYTSYLAPLKIKKIAKEMAYQTAEQVMMSFPLNFAIHYEDIKVVRTQKKGKLVILELVTPYKSVFLHMEKRLAPGLESLLGRYFGDRIDWKGISSIPPGSKYLPKWPDEKPISIPSYISPESHDAYLAIVKIIERNDYDAIIEKTSEYIDTKTLDEGLLAHLLYLNASAHMSKKEYKEAKEGYEKCIEIAKKLKNNPSIETLIELAKKAQEEAESKKGCFIATAVYGRDDTADIAILKGFRDTLLLETEFGTRFVHLYYKHSPKVAKHIESSPVLKNLVLFFVIRPLILTITWMKKGRFL